MQAVIHIRDPRDRVRSGHPWVFDNQVLRIDGSPGPGDIVRVVDDRGRPVGQGYYNAVSRILVRLLTREFDVRVNAGFFRERIQEAWDHRERIGCPPSRRVVFGEADGLPALVADLFKDEGNDPGVLVLQTLSLGMDRWKDVLVDALREVTGASRVFERNDVPIRTKEGLDPQKGFLSEPFETRIRIRENDLIWEVDVATGQKTGHFLDQRLNHASIAPIVPGARVLDCFTHTGGFALHAARYGASEVTGLDISADAVHQASTNAALNGLGDRCTFKEANVFDHLTEASRKGGQWDVIVLDPPAFAKSRSALDKAWRGYKEINLRAMKCLPRGGFLVTCSCSQHMTPDLFRDMVGEAARDARRQLRTVTEGGQPPDHPVHWSIPETQYLKSLVLQVL